MIDDQIKRMESEWRELFRMMAASAYTNIPVGMKLLALARRINKLKRHRRETAFKDYEVNIK